MRIFGVGEPLIVDDSSVDLSTTMDEYGSFLDRTLATTSNRFRVLVPDVMSIHFMLTPRRRSIMQ